MNIDKLDTRNLEKEITDLEAQEKYLCHLYEDSEYGMPLEYCRIARLLEEKTSLLESLRRAGT